MIIYINIDRYMIKGVIQCHNNYRINTAPTYIDSVRDKHIEHSWYAIAG